MWLKRKLRNWLISDQLIESVPSVTKNIGGYRNSMNISVHGAQGGYVLEFNVYDKKNDDRETRLYIITDEDDFSKKLSDIIMIETLRR